MDPLAQAVAAGSPIADVIQLEAEIRKTRQVSHTFESTTKNDGGGVCAFSCIALDLKRSGVSSIFTLVPRLRPTLRSARKLQSLEQEYETTPWQIEGKCWTSQDYEACKTHHNVGLFLTLPIRYKPEC
jgi:hypothetical protein